MENLTTSNDGWHYVLKGNKYGPISKEELLKLYEQGTIPVTTKVWKKGFSDWEELSKTGLTSNADQPPPLKGEDVKNTLIWVLAFTPIIGFLLQYIIAGLAQISINNLWFIPITMNTAICMIDIAYLKRRGYTEKNLVFWGLALIPVYLYKRAKLIKQQPYYLVVWIMMFIGTMFLAVVLSLLGSNVNDQRVHMVKNGTLEGYEDKTLGEIIEGVVENPNWEAIVDDSGNVYVNITGGIYYDSSKIDMLLQYKINNDNTFVFQALEFNREPQETLIYNILIEAMYQKIGPQELAEQNSKVDMIVNSFGEQGDKPQDEQEDKSQDEQGDSTQVQDQDTDGNHAIEADHGDRLLEGAGKEYIILDGASINEGKSREMMIDIDGDGEKEYFIIRRASQIGWEVMGASGGFVQNLISELYTDDAFDDEGEMRDDYYAQVTCYDLDGDGIQEILVSVGNKLTEMETLVYYLSNLNPQVPFGLAGNITGQEKMYIENGHTIVTPYGSQGLFTEYKYMDGWVWELDI